MIPPLVRRCPNCGHVGWSRRFAVVEQSPQVVACPACDHRFETVDNPS
ncbi:hypothetical protein ACFQL1_05030 [Halomicroarcula sp. GCM10025709]